VRSRIRKEFDVVLDRKAINVDPLTSLWAFVFEWVREVGLVRSK
jgi:hypothetical protein